LSVFFCFFFNRMHRQRKMFQFCYVNIFFGYHAQRRSLAVYSTEIASCTSTCTHYEINVLLCSQYVRKLRVWTRESVCVRLPLYRVLPLHIHFPSIRATRMHVEEGKEKKIRVFAPLTKGYWICWRCVEQMIAQLPPRKNLGESGGSVRLSPPRFLGSPPSLGRDRGLSNEESLRATKHSQRKCREYNHLELPCFRLALRFSRRNTRPKVSA